jgi:hypothetical protein
VDDFRAPDEDVLLVSEVEQRLGVVDSAETGW